MDIDFILNFIRFNNIDFRMSKYMFKYCFLFNIRIYHSQMIKKILLIISLLSFIIQILSLAEKLIIFDFTEEELKSLKVKKS